MTAPPTPGIPLSAESVTDEQINALHEALGGNGWAYSNYGYDELVTERQTLIAGVLAIRALTTPSDQGEADAFNGLDELIADVKASPEYATETVAAEAYQVIGTIASAGGLFDHPDVQRALDYFGGDREGEILPFAMPTTPASGSDGLETEWLREGGLIYSLMQQGWRKGQPLMVNDVMVRVETANGSTTDVEPIIQTILAALSPSREGVEPEAGAREPVARVVSAWASGLGEMKSVHWFGQIPADGTPLYAHPTPADDRLAGSVTSSTERMMAEREDEIVLNAMSLFRAFVGGSASRDVQNGTMTKAQADSWKAHAIRQHEESLRELAGVAALGEA